MPQLQGKAGAPRLNIAALADAVTARAAAQNLSMRELAHELGLAPSTLTRIRQGHRPDADALAVLLVWAGLTVEDLLSDSDPVLASKTRARQKRPPRPKHH